MFRYVSACGHANVDMPSRVKVELEIWKISLMKQKRSNTVEARS